MQRLCRILCMAALALPPAAHAGGVVVVSSSGAAAAAAPAKGSCTFVAGVRHCPLPRLGGEPR